MTLITAERVIAASQDEVFRAFSDIDQFVEVNPCVVSVEPLEGPESGVGKRFRETRKQGKSSMTMEFEVMEFDAPRQQRIACLSHGTLWDTTFQFSESSGGTKVVMAMDAQAQSWLPRLLNPLMKGLFRKGLVSHLDAVEAYFKARA